VRTLGLMLVTQIIRRFLCGPYQNHYYDGRYKYYNPNEKTDCCLLVNRMLLASWLMITSYCVHLY
jgi:hypothetical protein